MQIKRTMKLGVITFWLSFVGVSFAFADGMQSIEKFLHDKNSTISADFVQTVYGKKKNTISQGNMEISRPNRFRWQYLEGGAPSQLIMSNGQTLYIYDYELQQVTERRLSSVLGKSPALLLAGGNSLKKDYQVSELSTTDNNNDWVLLNPKNTKDNNGFQSINIGFNKKTGQLAGMKFIDSFGNKSSIIFKNVKTGIGFNKNEFQFVVKPGVDVIKAN